VPNRGNGDIAETAADVRIAGTREGNRRPSDAAARAAGDLPTSPWAENSFHRVSPAGIWLGPSRFEELINKPTFDVRTKERARFTATSPRASSGAWDSLSSKIPRRVVAARFPASCVRMRSW
jgi:hypothetical protein